MSLKDSLRRCLEKHPVIELSPELACQMRLAAGLRNRIAQGYSTVDHDRLKEEFQSGAKALRQFLNIAAEAVGL